MLRELFAAVCVTPLAIGCAPIAQAQGASWSGAEFSLVDQTCIQVMGLKRGEAYFAACRQSLSEALANSNQDRALKTAYADCRQRGLDAGTAAFSTCVLDASGTVRPQSAPLALAYSGNSGTEAGKSFYEVAPGIRFNRERYACAQLGLVAGSESFGQCVNSLDGAFLPSQN